MKKTTINFTLLMGAVVVMILSIWGPEQLAMYKDRMVLDILIYRRWRRKAQVTGIPLQ